LESALESERGEEVLGLEAEETASQFHEPPEFGLVTPVTPLVRFSWYIVDQRELKIGKRNKGEERGKRQQQTG